MLALACVAAVGVRGQGPAPAPILVVVNDSSPNPFGAYLPEILRAEGINSFSVVQLSALDAPTLGAAALTVLAESPLTAPQATLFTDYVTAGGRLVAMRPDAQLASVFGVTLAAGNTTNGYALVDQTGPGAGLQNLTLPFKGVADHYDMAGATSVAELYTSRTLSSGRAAVVRYNRTAAWSFDLARSTAYVRQGDPAFAGLDRDSQPPYRTNDIFYQTIDLERVGTPHADVQMRLFTRVIADLLADSQPLPRLWYFPGTSRTLLVPTADSHLSTPAAYAALLSAAESAGARISLYLARFLDVSGSPVTTWVANGHEVGLHPYFQPDGFELNFPAGYTQASTWFLANVPVPPGPTTRHHSLEWGGWVDPVPVMASFGIRMDLSYYSWGPALDNPALPAQAHGYITGSGLPMRFINGAGQLQSVYQQVTALTDEQLVTGSYTQGLTVPQALAVSQQMIDDSQAGGYSAIVTQFHVDYYQFANVGPWVDGTMAYAANHQVPMWTAERWLRFVEARVATGIADLVWSPGNGQLTFSVAVPAGAEPQSVMLPPAFGGRVISQVTLDGQTVAPKPMLVNGRATEFIQVAPLPAGGPRQVLVRYAAAASLPTLAIGDVSMLEGDAGTSQALLTVTLSAPSATDVTVDFGTSDGSATAGSDYQATSGTLTFAAGTTTQPIAITVIGDTADEGNETLTVTLSHAVGATLADDSAVVTLLHDEPPPTSWTDTTATDFAGCSILAGTRVGGAGDVRLAGAFQDDFTGPVLDPRWVSGSWTGFPNGAPYTPVPAGGVVSIGNADGAFVRSASPLTSTTYEVRAAFSAAPFEGIGLGDETFNTHYALFSTAAAGTHLWALTDPGTGAVQTDLGPIPAGEHEYGIERVVDGVTETFRYAIDGVVVAEHPVATGGIPAAQYFFVSHNGGATPTLDVDSVDAAPAFAASGTFDGCVIDAIVTMDWGVLSWNAAVPVTATLAARTRSSADGVTWSAWSTPMLVNGSSISSPSARYLQYRLELATSDPVSSPIVASVSVTALGPAPPQVSVANATAGEGQGPAAFAVSLSFATAQTVSVTYATSTGTAVSGTDFTAGTGTVTFAPGVTTQMVNVGLINDALDEDDETFAVTLTAPVSATLGTAVATGTIVDDDLPPTLSITGVTVTEGDTGSTNAVFSVALSAISGKTVTVTSATANGTAIAGSDFTAGGGVLTFVPGVTSQSVNVAVTGDILFEPDEVFTVTLSSPSNASLAVAQATGTITNDDALPTAASDSYGTPFNTPLVLTAPGVLGNDSNDGGGTMTASLVSGVAHGELVLGANGSVNYTPASGYSGIDSFVYRVADGSGSGNTATVTIAVGLQAPTPGNDAYATPFNTPLAVAAPGVLANDDAHTASGLTATLVSGTTHGTIVLGANGSVTYTPADDFAGTDTFTYRADSVAGVGGIATVTITVNQPTVVQAPQAFRVSAMKGTLVTFRWSAPALGPAPTGYVVEGGLLPAQTLAVMPTGHTAPIFSLTAPVGSFYVRVRALGAGGPSDTSNEILIHVGVPVAPSAPGPLEATVQGTSLYLASAPTFTGGAPSSLVLDVSGALSTSIPMPLLERWSFAGVPPGTYTVSMRAQNAGGSSPSSAPVTFTVPGACSGAPHSPQHLLAYAAGGTTSAVWDPPAAGDAPTGYLLSVTGFGTFAVAERSVSGGLPPGTYTISVRATGVCGTSAAVSQVVTVP